MTAAPRILVVAIKRFDMFGRKITRNIQYPAKFNMKKFMDGYIDDMTVSKPKKSSKSVKITSVPDQIYDLYGVVIHKGATTNSGHYFSYCKSASNRTWYECNDSFIRQMNDNQVLNREAYLLFY